MARTAVKPARSGQVAQSEVPVEAEQVDVPGPTQARLIRQDPEGGGRRTLVGVDEDEEFAVIVDLAWAEGELTDDEAAEILGSVRLDQEKPRRERREGPGPSG